MRIHLCSSSGPHHQRHTGEWSRRGGGQTWSTHLVRSISMSAWRPVVPTPGCPSGSGWQYRFWWMQCCCVMPLELQNATCCGSTALPSIGRHRSTSGCLHSRHYACTQRLWRLQPSCAAVDGTGLGKAAPGLVARGVGAGECMEGATNLRKSDARPLRSHSDMADVKGDGEKRSTRLSQSALVSPCSPHCHSRVNHTVAVTCSHRSRLIMHARHAAWDAQRCPGSLCCQCSRRRVMVCGVCGVRRAVRRRKPACGCWAVRMG